jgi:hypothetical protein
MGEGIPMGDSYQSIVDVEATADEAAELAERVLVLSVEAGVLPSVDSVSRNVMDMDRLEVWTGRKVFYWHRCVGGSADVLSPRRVRGQIAWASSVNAAAIRRAGGASSPSS